jgi:hypothetical protein
MAEITGVPYSYEDQIGYHVSHIIENVYSVTSFDGEDLVLYLLLDGNRIKQIGDFITIQRIHNKKDESFL